MAMRMICQGAVSRCMIIVSAKGNSCGVCRVGMLSAALTEEIWESPNTRMNPGTREPKASRASRA